MVTFMTVYGTNGFTNFAIVSNLTINGGTWTHVGNSVSQANLLKVSVGGSLALGSTGKINVQGIGFSAGQGPGRIRRPSAEDRMVVWVA